LTGWGSNSSTVYYFLFSKSSISAVGPTQPPIQCVMRVKLPQPDVDDAILPFVEVKNEWSYTSTVPTFHDLGQGPPYHLPLRYCPEGISRSHDFTKYPSHGAENLRHPFFLDVAVPHWVTGA
jgi:hypothetical protein